VTVGFCDVEPVGVPPGNSHCQEVGVFVERSVKVTESPAVGPVVEALKSTTGTGVGEGPTGPLEI
jgi:hypothetical protein